MRTREEIRTRKEIRVLEAGPDGGMGIIKFGQLKAHVIWSFGGGWDHVSVSAFKSYYIPSWKEMCIIKDIFFRPDEWAVQYHPAECAYINYMENCLHLWRPQKADLPTPPTLYV